MFVVPELPEVETIRKGLEPVLLGARIMRIELKRPGLRYPFPEDFVNRLELRVVTAMERRAKYILIHLSSGNVLLVHLGMSGRFLVEKDPADLTNAERKHDHVIFHMSNGFTISYRDPRRFGFMDLCSLPDLHKNRHLNTLGIEPLSPELDGAYLTSLFRHKNIPLKTVLLNQRLIAGLGNIYVCEALFLSKLHPAKEASSLKPHEAEKLAAAIQHVLVNALEAGGSTLKDYAQADGSSGYFQHQFTVYGRESEPCLSENCCCFISRITQNGRSTFFCPHCQKT